MVEQAHVIVVGGGFAGLGCVHELAKHPHHARVTLIDRHDYHQFLPLLYQVATFELASGDVAVDLSRALSTARFDRCDTGRRDRGRSGWPLGDARGRPNDRR